MFSSVQHVSFLKSGAAFWQKEKAIRSASFSLDHPNCRTARMYQALSWSVSSASRMTAFWVQPMVIASVIISGTSS